MPGLDLGEVEDVVDDVPQGTASAVDLVGVLPLARRQGTVQHQLGHADHGIERRADLVAHVGQEHGLGLGRQFGTGACLSQLALDELPLGDVPFDRTGHAVDRLAQGADFRDVPGFGQAHIVLAAGKLTGDGTDVLDGMEQFAAGRAQAQDHQHGRDGDARHGPGDPGAQAVARLAHLPGGPCIHLLKQIGDGHREAGPLPVVVLAVDLQDGITGIEAMPAVEAPVVRVVGAARRRDGVLLHCLEGLRLVHGGGQGGQLAGVEAQFDHALALGHPWTGRRGQVRRFARDDPIPVGGGGRIVRYGQRTCADSLESVVIAQEAGLARDGVSAHEAGQGVGVAAQGLHGMQRFEAVVLHGLDAIERLHGLQGDEAAHADGQQQDS